MEATQPKGPFCQSCGMPLGDMPDEFLGTNADGSKSEEYCSYCYNNGAFINPNMTLEQMIETASKGWSDQDPNVSYEQALEVSKMNIPGLKRWQ